MSSSLSVRRELVPSGALAAFFLSSVFFFGAPQLRAQSDNSQSSSQDVAEAARQERARKQDSSRKHVYTNEDLCRSKILTQEDQTRAAANRKQSGAPSAPAAQQNTEPLDANSNTPQGPLGDVARRYRDARRNAEKKSPFHLPSEQPELASPKILPPAPRPLVKTAPKVFNPVSPSVLLRRNPDLSAPSLSTPTHRIDPFARPRFQPAMPYFARVSPAVPRASVQPYAPPISSPRVPAPTSSQSIVVQKGDTLWNLSRQHLGKSTRWLELLAANPDLPDPTRLVPGSSLVLPSKIAVPRQASSTVTVQAGDTLSHIALYAYGHASYWPCVAQGNPLLDNPDRLAVGQLLRLPPSCKP